MLASGRRNLRALAVFAKAKFANDGRDLRVLVAGHKGRQLGQQLFARKALCRFDERKTCGVSIGNASAADDLICFARGCAGACGRACTREGCADGLLRACNFGKRIH